MSRFVTLVAAAAVLTLTAAPADAGLFDMFRRRPKARVAAPAPARHVAPRHVTTTPRPSVTAAPRRYVTAAPRTRTTAARHPGDSINAVPKRPAIPGFPDFPLDITYRTDVYGEPW